MAISQAQRTELLTLLVGMFDGAPTADLLSELATGLSNGGTLEAYAHNLGESAEFSSLYPTYLTSLEFAERFVSSLVDNNVAEDAKAEGAQFIAYLIDMGVSRGQATLQAIQTLAAVSEDDATWGQAVAQLNNKVAVAEYFALNGDYTGLSLEQMRSVTDGVTADDATVDAKVAAIDSGSIFGNSSSDSNVFELTSSTDRGSDFVGTSGNDRFEAFLAQNSFVGGVSNTLSSADRLDGQGGIDTLYAELVPEFIGATADLQNRIDVQPTTANIEIVEFQARDLASNNSNITVDAKNMTDIDVIGSNFSDGDLVIENLTTLESDGNIRNTADLTVSMVHTDNFNSDGDASDLTVYFDEDYLLSGQTSEAQAFYFLLDEDANLANNPDLLNSINVDGIRFSLDGGATIIDLDAPEAATAGTHAGFVAALQTALAELIADGTVPEGTTLTVDPTITDFTYLDSGARSVDIPAIVLTSGDGSVVTPVGFSQVEDAIGEYDLYGRFNSESQVSNDPISINIELEKVGRDGEGGNLIIGGKDQNQNGDTDVDQADGIEVFNISVLGDEDKPSNLGSIMSTNGTLRTVNIVTDADFVGGDTFAALTVRGQDLAGTANDETPFGGTLDTINANSFLGDLSIGQEYAAQDVNTLNAAGGGDVYFNASITEDAEGIYNYATGMGSDEVIVTVQGDAVDDVNTSLTISTGGNDDKVQVVMGVDQAGLSQATSAELQNLRINTGSGADEVNLDAYGKFYVTTGEGSDFVRVNSVDENGDASTGTWVIGDASGVQTFAERVLYKAELTLTFAGLESTVSINTIASNNFRATQLDINEALAKAIADSPELSRLLEITEGDGTQQVTIESLVGGLNDLNIAITQPEVIESGSTAGAGQVILSSGDVSSVLQGLIQTGVTVPNGSSASAANVVTALATIDGNIDNTGTAGGDYLTFDDGGSSDANIGISYSVINMGSGSNDLVVMHSHEDSANVLEINQTFGKVTVVNFHDVSPNDVTAQSEVGNHAIDFTHYLDNTTDASSNGNNYSEQAIAVTLNTNNQLAGSLASTGTALANSVNMLNFDNTLGTLAWEDLTAANLVAALNGGTSVGGIVDGTLEAVASTANLVGTVQKHIVMVENNANVGEYKVFYLTSANNNTTGDFDTNTATLLGTLDFGASINFPLVGSTEWESSIESLLTTKNDSTQIYDNASYTLDEASKTNDLTNSYSIEDTLENLLAGNVDNPTGTQEILANAESITISDSDSGLNEEEIEFTGLLAGSAGSAINFDDDEATLSLSELQLITGSSSGQYNLNTDVSDQLTIEGTDSPDTILADDGSASYIYNLNDGDDTLYVTQSVANVQVNGGNGTDTVDFGLAVSGLQDDDLVGVENIDISNTGNASYDFSAQTEALVITGNTGQDTITGGLGADTINGGAGNDTFVVADNDIIDGGADNDTVQFEAAVSAANLEDADLQNVEFVEILNTGDAAYDFSAQTEGLTITGNTGADNITGGSAADTIDGGLGNDTLTGGLGNDTFNITSSSTWDLVTDLTTGDAFVLSDGATMVAQNVVNFTATSATQNNNTLLNTAYIDVQNVLASTVDFSNVVAGSAGFSIRVGSSNALANTFTGSSFDDIFSYDIGGGANLTNDTVNGGAGVDTLNLWSGIGGGSVNIADAAFANKTNLEAVDLSAGGTATITLDTNANSAFATGIEIQNISTGALVVNGANYSHNITAIGSNNDDTLTGGAGADTITGGAGADTITGGAGADTITGGAGSDIINLTDADGAVDTLVYSATSDGTDTITGFVSGVDQIEIDGALQTQLDDVTVDTSFTWVSATDGNTSAAESVDLSIVEAIFMDTSNSNVLAADLTNGGAVLQAIDDQFNTTTSASGESWFVVVESSDNAGTFGVYVVTDAGSGDIDNSGDNIQILGVVTGDTVATTDFIMA